MDLDMMLADKEYEVQVEDIKKMIIGSRNSFNASDSQIMDLLEKQYGDHFSKDQLQTIMNQVK